MLRELFKKHSDDISFAEPSNEAEIADAAEALGTPFPDSLRCALKESNGIQGKYEMDLLWSVSRIVNDNKSFRTNMDFRDLYMPFDSLLFFGDAGSGDQFAFVVLNGEVRRRDIFVWNHECDSRSWIAPSLETFYEWLLTGKIDI